MDSSLKKTGYSLLVLGENGIVIPMVSFKWLNTVLFLRKNVNVDHKDVLFCFIAFT